MEEAEVIVNGKKLTTGEVMTLRVALSGFVGEMASDPNALGTDDIGRRIRDGYIRNGRSVEKMLVHDMNDRRAKSGQ